MMADPSAFAALKTFLGELHPRLFEAPFEIVLYQDLMEVVDLLTLRLNQSLPYYHSLETLEEKIGVKPTLDYVQELLAHMCRLLRFEPQHLTPHNQLVVDLEKMLLNREQLIATRHRERAAREIALFKDEKLRKMLEAAFHTYLF